MKSILAAFLAALALLVFWRQSVSGGSMFYQGIAVALVAAFIHRLWPGLRARPSAGRDGLLVFLLVYAFVFTIPTTVDRAYSVRMLTRIAAEPTGVSRQEIVDHFAQDFASSGAVDRRLREQSMTGTIAIVDERWRLTPLGHLLTRAFHYTCVVFRCENS